MIALWMFCRWNCNGVFRSQNDLFPAVAVGNKFAEKFFAASRRVDFVGGVNVIAARLQRGIENFLCFGFISAPPEIRAEGHFAERDFRDAQS